MAVAGSVEDDGAVRLQLTLPEAQIVFLQAIIDGYEGLAVVRTICREPVLIELQTTPSMLTDLQAVLESLREQIGWKEASEEVSGGRL